MKTSAQSREQTCPACGGVFTVSVTSRKKVQCPKCRDVVTLTASEEINRTVDHGAERDSPMKPDWMARCEHLRARLEKLEQRVEALMVSSRPWPPLIPDRLAHSKAASRESPAPSAPPAPAFQSLASALPETGRAEPPATATPGEPLTPVASAPHPEITLLVDTGAKAGRRAVETLKEILTRAGWKSVGVLEDLDISHHVPGLTLAAGGAIPLPRVMRTLSGLREAGFALTYQIDPDRGANEAVLIIGPDSPSESEPGRREIWPAL